MNSKEKKEIAGTLAILKKAKEVANLVGSDGHFMAVMMMAACDQVEKLHKHKVLAKRMMDWSKEAHKLNDAFGKVEDSLVDYLLESREGEEEGDAK